jgi:predicted lipoprotein with Yx(FWY)xxD motif
MLLRMKITAIGTGLIAALLLAGCGGGASTSLPHSNATVLSTAIINGSPAFVNSVHHAVYTSDGDTTKNQSNCTGECAAVWPPVPPPSVTLTAPWASFSRADGSLELSYNGKPLYTFSGDTAPDVATGDGLNGFHVARPLPGAGNGVSPGNPGYNP